MKRFFFIIMLVVLAFSACKQKHLVETPLFKLTDSQASLKCEIICADSLQLELNGAIERFVSYVNEAIGVRIPVNNTISRASSVIVFSIINKTDKRYNIMDSDGFILECENDTLSLKAISEAGIQSGVTYLLEHYFGCRFYSTDVIVIPKLVHPVEFRVDNIIENPAFSWRVLHAGDAYNKKYSEWHRLHNANDDDGLPVSVAEDWGMWVHTFKSLIPTEKYFKEKTNYFAYRNGKRVADQLCLSNEELLQAIKEELTDTMAKYPNAKYWSLSQNDNFNYCLCDNCQKDYEYYTNPSGQMLEFVNSIAKMFPEKKLSTLAYQYTRHAPQNIKPDKNVVMMLCSIECDRSKAILEGNPDFVQDLSDWTTLTDEVLVWDYVVNFSHLLLPFPNFYLLAENLKLFQNYGVKMIFEQGFPGKGGDNADMRSYLLSKLMWNPYFDVDSLIIDFCEGYYGVAGAKYVYQYINEMTQELIKSGQKLTLYEPVSAHKDGYLSPKNLKRYMELFKKGLDVTSDSACRQRLYLAQQPLWYAYLEIAKALPYTADWVFEESADGKGYVPRKEIVDMLGKLCRTAEKYGPYIFHEMGVPPTEYYEKYNHYLQNGYVDNIAKNKKIYIEKPPAAQYSAEGEQTLIDGVRGTENYFALWQGWQGEDVIATIDLLKPTELESVSVSCLVNQNSWIFAPTEIVIYGGESLQNMKLLKKVENNIAVEKRDKAIMQYKISLEEKRKLQFLRVSLKNVEDMPAWTRTEGKTWLFVDEIIVQ